jgi:D-glycero-D-manno-heptose 1,7-bisphosphate phosphatase
VKYKTHFRQAALFLDRDGVINIEKNYVHQINDFEFVEGIFELCTLAKEKDLAIVIVTNQAGIGRGYYSETQFQELMDWVKLQFKNAGTPIAGVYFCPYHPTHGIGQYRKDSFERKPNPGMLLLAADELELDLANSIMIGDKGSDIKAGKSAGVKATFLLGVDDECSGPDWIISSLDEASTILKTI